MSAIELVEVGDVALLELQQPVLAVAVLDELTAVLDAVAEAGGRRPLVLSGRHPRIFLAGAHLGEIAALDRDTSGRYANRGRAVLSRLGTLPGPTLAAVAGACSGGGFDLALACDGVVASPRASFRHPGVVRGLVTGWSGSTRLAWMTGRARARAAVLGAAELGAMELTTAGVVLEIADDPVPAALELARRLAGLDPVRLDHWRRLRHGRFVDRFRASVIHSC
jgi:enoyl-CoA hydratase/carnithine racemase